MSSSPLSICSPSGGPSSASPVAPSDGRAVVQAFVEALDAHDVDRATRQFGTAYRGIDVTRSALTFGPDEARADIERGLAAFPGLSCSVHQCVAQGDYVSVFWSMRGRHEGTVFRIPPTGKQVSISGSGLLTIRDGAIVRGVYLWDLAGLLRTVNLLPDLPASA